MNLLPKHHDEFHKKDYWDQFFRERNETFEWYGSFKNFALLCFRNIQRNEKCLVLGCGNSAFSSDLYDHGFKNITNVDFSEQVISSMRENNLHRGEMLWEVMDMTNLTYPNESFDIILDKGGLDALMSANTIDAKNQAFNMFESILRVLRVNGKYICITLAEDFIIEQLLGYFSSTMSYIIQIYTIQTDSPSPFKTFVVIITKTISNPIIELFFDNFGTPVPNSKQLQLPVQETLEMVHQVQLFSQKKFEMSVVKPGSRFEVIEIFSTHAYPTIPRFSIIVYDYARKASRSCAVFFVPSGREMEYQFSTPGGLATIAEQAGCRRLLAVRCNKPHEFPPMPELQVELSSIALSLAPGDIGDIKNEDRIPYVALQENSGWETIETGTLDHVGLYCVEESSTEECKRRLIFLENQQFIQTEVRLNITLGGNQSNQNQKKGKKKKGGNDLKSNEQHQQQQQPLFQFDYTFLDDHHRAMLVSYLGANFNVIKDGYRARSRGHINENTVERNALLQSLNLTDICTPWLPIEYLQYLHSKQSLSSIPDDSTSLPTPPPTSLPSLPPPTPTSVSLTNRSPRTLLIGLGGGSLAMAIQKYLPFMSLDIVELVPGLEEIATRHFGFIKSTRTRILTGDGLEVINSMIQHNQHMLIFQYDCIILDIDSKDLTSGLSAPPKEFITLEMIQNYHSLLSSSSLSSLSSSSPSSSPSHGLLSINVVTRNQQLFQDLSDNLSKIFLSHDDSGSNGNIFRIVSSSENVNVTLHATSYGSTLPHTTTETNSTKNKKNKKNGKNSMMSPMKLLERSQRRELEEWLQGLSLANDPLGLDDLIDKIEYLSGGP